MPRTPSPTHRTSTPLPANGRRTPSISGVGAGAVSQRRTPEETLAGDFKNCMDYSKRNLDRHSARRDDTFGTPSQLDERYKVPSRLDKRYGLGDTHELRTIFDQEFAKTIRSLGSELIDDVRAELRQALQSDEVRQEREAAKSAASERDAAQTATLEMILGRIAEIKEDAAQAKDKPLDFQPVNEIVKGCERSLVQAHQEMTERLEKSIKRSADKVLDEIDQVRRQQEQTENVTMFKLREDIHKLKFSTDLTDMMRGTETQLQHIVVKIEASFSEVQSVVCRTFEDLTPSLENQLTKFLGASGGGVAVNFNPVLSQLSKTYSTINNDFEKVTNEIKRIQQAMNMDFEQPSEDDDEEEEEEEDDEEDAPEQVATTSAEGTTGDGSVAPVLTPDQPLPALGDLPGADDPNAPVDPDAAAAAPIVEAPKPKKKPKKRLRENYMQTVAPHLCHHQTQTDGSVADLLKEVQATDEAILTRHKQAGRPVFVDAEAMKRKMREKLVKPPFTVSSLYKTKGLAQWIARSWAFEQCTFVVILLNSVWIAVDSDWNTSDSLNNAHPVFQVAENLFCAYFAFEVLIRWLSFKKKRTCVQDAWFPFDAFLGGIMIFETWVVTFVFGMIAMENSSDGAPEDMGDASIFRMLRIVKMCRVARMARLMRAIPELVILVKGIGTATRSVGAFLLMWVFMLYIFGVTFRQLSDGGEIGEKYFATVPDAMNTLLLNGILPMFAPFVDDLRTANAAFFPFIMLFILLASIMLMYMLIGVLVEVVGVVASTEKEALMVSSIAGQLREAFSFVQHVSSVDACSQLVTKREFQRLISEQEILEILQESDVDAVVLLEMCDLIFEDYDKDGNGITFENFVEIVLNMRGTSPATMKSINESVRVMNNMVRNSVANLYKDLCGKIDRVEMAVSDTLIEHTNRTSQDDSSSDDDCPDWQKGMRGTSNKKK